jgi:hypothetical protein
MHISVHVRSSAPTTSELALTTHSLIVFAPLEVDAAVTTPLWRPVTAEDKALEEHAQHLIRLRARVTMDPRLATYSDHPSRNSVDP